MSVLILLAPSKTMDLVSVCPLSIKPQEPLFLDQASKIANKLAGFSLPKLMRLMQVSHSIAEAVHQSYAAWNPLAAGKPALWTYTGDVYKGFQAANMTSDDAKWAQQHLVIASGLYGLARPFDGIQAYRLEMKATLTIGRRRNLYDFWADSLARYIETQPYDWLCNCSSEEYARPVLRGLKLPVVTPVFFDTRPNGIVGPVPIYSKMMRGVFARWMIDERITSPDQLTAFQAHGYRYDAERSKPNSPAFSRSKMVPLRFS